MNGTRQITASQIMTTVTNSMVGITILSLPRIASELANTGAVVVTLLGVLFALFSMLILTILAIRFPRTSLIESSIKIVGRPFAFLYGLLIMILFILFLALITREFSEMLSSFLYPDTPKAFLIGVMLLI